MAGLITTAHPCPFTINLAAISMLGGMTSARGKIVMVTIYFICGYVLSFLLLSVALSSGIISVPLLSIILRKYIGLFIGPLLILAGMLQTDLINTSIFHDNKIMKYILSNNSHEIHALPLGFVIALSFCPATAAIFFGLLIPLAVEYKQNLLFPSIYALGASVPIIVAGILVSGGYSPGKRNRWKKIFPLITGWALIIIGIYISIIRIFLS